MTAFKRDHVGPSVRPFIALLTHEISDGKHRSAKMELWIDTNCTGYYIIVEFYRHSRHVLEICYEFSLFIRVHATLHPVCLSVTLYFFYDFYFWTSLLLPKWSSDLKYYYSTQKKSRTLF